MLLSTLLLVLLMFAAGYVFTRLGIFEDTGADVINKFVVYVSLPALVLHAVPALRWDPSLLVLVLVPWATLVLGVAACLAASRAFRWPRPVEGALLLCAPLGNTSFLGLPLLAAVRGPEAVQYGLIYDQAGSFLILSTYGVFVLARYSGAAPPTAATIIRRVLTFPPFLALVIALLPLPRPAALDTGLARIGDTLAPLAMFAVGMRLRLRPPAERSALALGIAIKMLLLPLCTYAVTKLLGLQGLAVEVAILEAAMPAMLTASALASMAGLAPQLCAALAGYGIMVSFVLVPLWAALL